MIVIAALALLAWLYLALLHGGWWRTEPVLRRAMPHNAPPLVAIVPARNEAPTIAAAIASLLGQNYPGPLRVVLVDDESSDATASIARSLPGGARLSVLAGTPRPPGWAGKLWAVKQGIDASDEELILLTDADIVHDPGHAAALLAAMLAGGRGMVSGMVALRCESLAERALIPAFVHFFQLLYPFRYVNDARHRTAAAAGGTVLIRRETLQAAGGIEAIHGALIDDVSLARAVKPTAAIALLHTPLARSIRPYPSWRDIGRMIARSAYVQLGNSPLLLAGTLLGLAVLFLAPPGLALFGQGGARWVGLAGWGLMAATYLPSLRRYQRSRLWAPFLPLVAVFYMGATLAAALAHHRGRGVQWKSRAYPNPARRGAA
ncbi:MAG: glycosyltransferase [Rhodospirillales bacterium]|nr:glycosyltransferase [Rhodospirillales bacterium]